MKGSQGGTAAWGQSLDSPVRAQPLARVHGHALALVPEPVPVVADGAEPLAVLSTALPVAPSLGPPVGKIRSDEK